MTELNAREDVQASQLTTVFSSLQSCVIINLRQQEVIVIGLFVCLFVCLSVCLLAGYLKKFKSNLDETWQACRPYDWLQVINLALAEVCTL